MCAEQQPELVESVEDYSKQWSELIDRGDLYHINDKVSTFYQVTVLVFMLLNVISTGIQPHAGS